MEMGRGRLELPTHGFSVRMMGTVSRCTVTTYVSRGTSCYPICYPPGDVVGFPHNSPAFKGLVGQSIWLPVFFEPYLAGAGLA